MSQSLHSPDILYSAVLLPKLARVIVCLAFLLAAGCDDDSSDGGSDEGASVEGKASSGVPAIDLVFVDVADSSGLHFTYQNGQQAEHAAILESLGGGVGLLDFDRDGAIDVALAGGGGFSGQKITGQPTGLFRNLGGLSFENVSSDAGVSRSRYYSHGIAETDVDSDGFPDFLVTGFGGLQLFLNNGDGTFLEAAVPSGLTDSSWSSSAAFGDFNGDGHPDLYVTHYVDWSFENHPICEGPRPETREVCPPRIFEPLPDTLYLSRGDGSFVDASVDWNLSQDGKGLGVVAADGDLDGDLDLYVGNDTVANFLYLNEGDHFTETGLISGTAFGENGRSDGSMGVDVADFNGDGLPDLWVANYESESFGLYRNDGSAYFQLVSSSTGVKAVGELFVGWGTVFFDPDLDGDSDVIAANGHVIRFPQAAPIRQRPLLLLNDSGKRLHDVAEKAGDYTSTPHMARGLASGDLDNDGDPDLVVSHTNEPVAVLDNRSSKTGAWIRLRLIGTRCSRIPIGAVVRVTTDSGKQLTHQIRSGGSYASSSDNRLLIGLGQSSALKDVEVSWPGGHTTSFGPLPIGIGHDLVEPQD